MDRNSFPAMMLVILWWWLCGEVYAVRGELVVAVVGAVVWGVLR